MIFRRIVGGLLLAATVSVYLFIGTMSDVQREFYSPFADLYVLSGLWAVWSLIVLFMVRDSLPLGVGRFVLRMFGIDR